MEGGVDVDVGGVPQPPQLPLRSRRHRPATQIDKSDRPPRARGPGSLRVTVAHADGGHAGKQVQVALAVHVPQPLHVALVDENRLLVVGHPHGHGEAVPLADLQDSLFGHSLDNGRMKRRPPHPHGGKDGLVFTLNSSGLKSHGGISGTSVVEDLKAEF